MLTGKSHSVGKITLANSENHTKLVGGNVSFFFLFIYIAKTSNFKKKKRETKHNNNQNQTKHKPPNTKQKPTKTKQSPPGNKYSKRTRPDRGEKNRKFLQRLYSMEVHHCFLLLMSKGI